jgi:hypothetical protein
MYAKHSLHHSTSACDSLPTPDLLPQSTIAFGYRVATMVSISLQRGSLSLSFEISRSSIYSSNSYTSLEPLVPKAQPRRYSSTTTCLGPPSTKRNLNSQNLGVVRGQKRRMATNGSTAVVIEQKKSYGIGGAGNIRLCSLFGCM